VTGRRILVVGGTGFFGRAVVERLRADGARPLVGCRGSGAGVRVDVEDTGSVGAALEAGDVVVDTAGPFQRRSTRLVERAIEVGADLVDIADGLDYVRRVVALGPRAAARGVRIFTACSAISAIGAAIVRASGVGPPVRVSGYLAPATRDAACRGTTEAFVASLGRPIEVLRDGRLETVPGWRSSRVIELPPPAGRVRGWLFESADSITLPAVWPSLATVDFHVDPNGLGLAPILWLAARCAPLARWLERPPAPVLALARVLGRRSGCLGYEVEGQDGRLERHAFIASDRGWITPIVPAVMVALALTRGLDEPAGVVPPDRHVGLDPLVRYLERVGVRHVRSHRGAP
jgi:short subunit dehydrogenase-like uncharacterized protein